MEDNILDEQLGELMAPQASEEPETAAPTEPPAAPEKATRPRGGKKDQPKVKADVKITEKAAPADDRIRIIIDREKGMSSFETVGVNGKVYQIERGVAVYVPPEVVHVLELAVMTDTTVSKHPITGERVETTTHFSSIPWRRA